PDWSCPRLSVLPPQCSDILPASLRLLSFDLLPRARSEQFSNGAAPGDAAVRRNFPKRLQHKRPLMHAGMWQSQATLVPLQPIIHEYVEIKRSRGVGIFTHAPVIALDFQQGFEQIMGGEGGFNQRHRIDEIRLV